MNFVSKRRFLLGVSALAVLSAAGRQARADSTPAVGSSDVRTLIDAYNASGRQLFEAFVQKPGNIVFSPYSIGTAMAMALSGARGATERAMASVLQQWLTRPQMEIANQKAMAILNGQCAQAGEPKCDKDHGRSANRLLIANALMLTKALGKFVSPDYVALAKDRYAAEVFKDATLEQINGWVNEKTEGKISEILDSLPPDSVAVLINAIYFKAAWLLPFSKSNTIDGDFNVSSSAKVKAPMMHMQAEFAWLSGSGYHAIRLPFAGPSLGFIVVLPDALDGLGDVVRGLDFDAQKQLFADLTRMPEGPVTLSLPKLKANFEAELAGPFEKLGMNLAFSDDADFSGMTGQHAGFEIGGIFHKAVIELAEEGVEAAAVTAMKMMEISSPPPPRPLESFIVDRPFLFFVVDDATGAVLFEGRIVDPTKAA